MPTLPSYTPTAVAPVAIAEASYTPTVVAPTAIPEASFAPSNVAPGEISLGDYAPTTTPAVPVEALAPVASLPANMPSIFAPAFVNLTGGGVSLSTLNATVADLGKVLQGTVAGELKSYQVRTGTDAQALPGIVHPANFDVDENPVVFVAL